MKIILVRHGESHDDTINCYGGAADFELSEFGLHAAQEVAKTFSEIAIEKIYSSPLKRARQTAEAINTVKQCDIGFVDNLKERNSYGVLSGCNKEDSKSIYEYLLSSFEGKPGDYYSNELLLGAEPLVDFDMRVEEALLSVVKDAQQNGFEVVVVVTHGNVTRSIYKNILKFEKKIDLDFLARTVIEYDNSAFSLISNQGVTEK